MSTKLTSQVYVADRLQNRLQHPIDLLSLQHLDTNWPPESEDAAQNLQRTINNLPNLPQDVAPIKDTVERFIHVLEAVYSTLKKASETYGKKERGFRDMIKYGVASLRRSKCTDILETGREDIENISTTLRAKTVEETLVSEHPTCQQALIRALPSNLPKDQETLNQVRAGALTVARRTFQAVEVVSGAIPVVGSYVGGVAKVGLAFVNMIETMDKNEDVVKELASRTSRLSTYLEHFKNKLNAEHGDVIATHIQDLHRSLESQDDISSRELGFIEKKVSQWHSLGHFKKALLAGDHAEELKSHQDAVRSALEETQLLVSLKTTDLVIELKNKELRAERHRLLGCLGDGRYGARGNSIDDVVCLPGTRVEILDRINKWIKNTSASAERVLWIRGMAGHGKSTIASTVAHMWASKGSCAIFHFRRGHNASDDQFICALVRQLGKGLVPEVKNAILDCVRENEDIIKERLDQQFKTLFVGSLGKLQGHAHPIIIIVDALDECENVSNVVRFVKLIDQHSSFLPINVKFLLTCRPEAPLLVALEPRKWHAEDLDSVSHVFEDITRFIRHACAQIREDHDLPETWPSSSDVKRLVEMSQGLFQWARTAVTYVGDASPDHRLRELLQHSSKWGELDYLYNQILSKAFKRNSMRKQLLSWVLETLVVAPYPVSLEVITFLHADHEIFKGQEDNVRFLRRDILADLNSLLHIPTSPCEPLRLMHTSIRDLLIARERCEDQHYFVDLIRSNRRLANVSLGVMERDLRQNICNLSDLSRANSEVQYAVESHVPKGLQYSCRSWFIHLIAGIQWSEINGEGSNDVLSKLTRVSEEKLLAWLEVMGLIGATEEALTVAKQVHEWLLHWPREMSNGDMITLWNDTQRFIVLFLEPISFGALHIYASALPHCPMETKLWARYGDQATTRIVLGKRLQDWSANIWTSFADPSFRKPVLKVEFSPNGRVLAAVLTNGEVHLLDTQTGVPVGNVGVNVDADGGQDDDKEKDKTKDEDGDRDEGGDEDNCCWSYFRLPRLLLRAARTWPAGGDPLIRFTQDIAWILFSPDSRVLAPVLSYQALRLWDARTTVHLGDLVTGRLITSLAFLPDSETLAAVLDSNTVRLWDARTGTQLSDPLTSHEGKITFTVFSPDGKVLASVSDAKTVQLWDTQTGAQLCDPLTSHEYDITSIVLSPDGKFLASVLDDDKIQLWDVRTGTQVGDFMAVGKDRIHSVVFLLDGEVVAAMLPGNRVQLWDARTGVQLGDTLTGREYCDTSIIFSPDGRVLVSMPQVNTAQL
ncbi:hypothetical protein FRC04_009222 [Tulasnella sp. 424]|nr:hypothetical protein FRC04_009222 [Tulasnella sp. 424]